MTNDEPWIGSKRQRADLREKFGGKCAYCGCILDKMHADHLEPCIRVTRDPCGKPLAEPYMIKPERNTVANMMPACASCNLHKGGYSLEGWRDILQRSASILRRDTSTFRAGERFGIISVTEQPVVFFFEILGRESAVAFDPGPAMVNGGKPTAGHGFTGNLDHGQGLQDGEV